MFKSWKARLLLVAFAAISLPGFLLAKGSPVRFSGVVARVDRVTSTQGTATVQGTVTVRLAGFEVPVQVNGDTEIESDGDQVGLAGIGVGDFLKVRAFFVNNGIMAEEIDILDDEAPQFRLRGNIDTIQVLPAATLLRVLGVDFTVNSETQIDSRGSGLSTPIASLAPGMFVDARGIWRAGVLVATHIKVGRRVDDAVRIEFEGRITKIQGNRLEISVGGVGAAIVLIVPTTRVRGTIALQRFVEVDGTLNAQLEVVASEIKVDANGNDDADDDNPDDNDNEFERKIALVPVAVGIRAHGEAEAEFEQEGTKIEQKFEVELEDSTPNTDFRILVEISGSGTVDFGSARTDSDGDAKVKFSGPPKSGERNLAPLLPAGKDVRNFIKVQITNTLGVALLEGRF